MNSDEALQILKDAKKNMLALENAKVQLAAYHQETAETIIGFLQVERGLKINPEAIKATVRRPYTIFPINENEAWLIHWRGIDMPVFGWVVAQEPAFLKCKVTRSMDLLTPFPAWMKDELGWKPPEHQAVIDGTRTGIKINEGDEASFKRKYGQFLGGKQGDGTFKIRGGDAWIKLVASLVRDGILPYSPQPVSEEHWDENVEYPNLLLDLIDKKEKQAQDKYIRRAINEFVLKGAVLVNYPPGSGKTLTTCAVLNHFKGRVLILGDSTMLIEQWRDRVKVLVNNPNVEIVISTYQGAAKYLNEDWDLIIPDEAQRLPANTFSKLAFAKTKYRLGLTGTAWREDERQHLIVALSGFPVAIRWSALIASGALRRPRIRVITVANEAAKNSFVKSLIDDPKRRGRAMIFCDWIEQGDVLAKYLDVPFIHGGTTRKYEKIQDAEVSVVSRIGDRGISLSDLRLVVEVAGAGSAREQFAQRVGRLLHGEFDGDFVTVFTPEEARKYRGRVFGVEAELAGEVDIEFIDMTGNKDAVITTSGTPQKSHKTFVSTVRKPAPSSKPKDDIARTMEIPAIASKIDLAKYAVGTSSIYVERVLRYCWDTALSGAEIAEGLGIVNAANKSRINTSCKACVDVKLMTVDDKGRYQVDQNEINRIKKLSQLRDK